MSTPTNIKTIVTAEQLSKRVRDIARQISEDYRGRTLFVVGVLENGFIFMADLVRAIEVPLNCQFIKPFQREILDNNVSTTEIFYDPEIDVRDKHVLLVEGIMQTGLTSEFLIRNLLARGAASVKVAALLDRPSQRRVSIQPDYFGFLVDEKYVFGYGLGTPDLNRNLPHIAAVQANPPATHT